MASLSRIIGDSHVSSACFSYEVRLFPKSDGVFIVSDILLPLAVSEGHHAGTTDTPRWMNPPRVRSRATVHGPLLPCRGSGTKGRPLRERIATFAERKATMAARDGYIPRDACQQGGYSGKVVEHSSSRIKGAGALVPGLCFRRHGVSSTISPFRKQFCTLSGVTDGNFPKVAGGGC